MNPEVGEVFVVAGMARSLVSLGLAAVVFSWVQCDVCLPDESYVRIII